MPRDRHKKSKPSKLLNTITCDCLRLNARTSRSAPNQSYSGRQYPLLPAFNFGEGFLFSGTIKSNYDEYQYGQIYPVDVKFETVEGEVFTMIKHLITIGMKLNIQTGSHIIGSAKLLDCKYID
ncbi:MAG: hypothetical protein FWG53_05290 [Clostridiales bacterium]|nr:hypothetical protein [Clostridiales bacterium]